MVGGPGRAADQAVLMVCCSTVMAGTWPTTCTVSGLPSAQGCAPSLTLTQPAGQPDGGGGPPVPPHLLREVEWLCRTEGSGRPLVSRTDVLSGAVVPSDGCLAPQRP